MIVTNTWSGIYIQIILGPSTNKTTRMLQYLGVGASLASMSKGAADWWVRAKSGGLQTHTCLS